MTAMSGAVVLAIVIVFVIPPIVLMLGGIFSALIGWAAKSNAETEHEGSPFVDLNY